MNYTDEQLNAILASRPEFEKQHLVAIITELDNARDKHPDWPSDAVHKAAIVGEEAGELIRAAINYFYEDGSPEEMYKEATQTAATAVRLLIDNPKD